MKVNAGQAQGFALFESELPPHAGGPPVHVHDADDEAFYVLRGNVTFEIDAATYAVAEGGMAFVPRGTRHTFANPTGAVARMLVIATPEALALIEAHGAAAGDPEKLRELYRSHRSEIVA